MQRNTDKEKQYNTDKRWSINDVTVLAGCYNGTEALVIKLVMKGGAGVLKIVQKYVTSYMDDLYVMREIETTWAMSPTYTKRVSTHILF